MRTGAYHDLSHISDCAIQGSCLVRRESRCPAEHVPYGAGDAAQFGCYYDAGTVLRLTYCEGQEEALPQQVYSEKAGTKPWLTYSQFSSTAREPLWRGRYSI